MHEINSPGEIKCLQLRNSFIALLHGASAEEDGVGRVGEEELGEGEAYAAVRWGMLAR